MTWSISKEFDFCYGHRVWNQELDKTFSITSKLSCRHLHGHQGKIIIHLTSDKLQNAMVTDFNHLNWFKVFLDNTLDHKFIIDINDPLFNSLLPLCKDSSTLEKCEEGYKKVKLDLLDDAHQKEMYESYIIVDFVPTSENISAWILKIVQEKMKNFNIKVSHIEFYESPKSKSVVYT